jgi:hypothetical protein
MGKFLLGLLIAMGGPLGGFAVSACAQSGNPLRVNQPVNQRSNLAASTTATIPAESMQRAEPEMPPEVREAIYAARRDRNPGAPFQNNEAAVSSNASDVIVDRQVSPALLVREPERSPSISAATIPKSDLAGINGMLDALQARQLEVPASARPVAAASMPANIDPPVAAPEPPARFSSADGFASPSVTAADPDQGFNQQRFQKLLQQIAFNTCIVMCVGVGFILIAKQWYFKQGKPATRTTENTIQITSTLRLSPKANLFLVSAGSHRLIVASDQNGINSVVPLTDSFAGTLDSLAATEVEEEKSTPTNSGGSLAGLYSLATVGKANAARTDKKKQDQGNDEALEEIKRKMEAALDQHGLKELFVQTMRSQG